MIWSAPSLLASSVLRALTTAVTCICMDLATWMAKVPTPPEAPLMRMLLPGSGSAALTHM